MNEKTCIAHSVAIEEEPRVHENGKVQAMQEVPNLFHYEVEEHTYKYVNMNIKAFDFFYQRKCSDS